MTIEDKISVQRKRIEEGNPKIELLNSCRVGNGIQLFGLDGRKKAIRYYEERASQLTTTFFIPSSGSGSRMFGMAYDFIENDNPGGETIKFIEHLIHSIEEFAFYNKLPQRVKSELKSGSIDIDKFILLLLSEEGFNFGNRPKGLIPFHRYGNFIINPFQEHILQGVRVSGERSRFHFTIHEIFEKEIRHSIKILREITGIDVAFDFSVQDKSTNSIAFGQDGEPVKDADGSYITRPSGHGALLNNLNAIDADLIYIRNIDNIQHEHHSKNSVDTRKALTGKLLEFQALVFDLLHQIEQGIDVTDALYELNETYELRLSDIQIKDPVFIKAFLSKPIRICGMVRNEGQPGGGPFWVKNSDGLETKQIVEKSQISNKSSQLNVLIKSTHFNPVEIICATKDRFGHKYDLHDFKNDSQYFIVNKTQKGIPVQFIEQPGLWNGGMFNWLTLFFEMENTCFSPVKTVLDLLKPLHQPNPKGRK